MTNMITQTTQNKIKIILTVIALTSTLLSGITGSAIVVNLKKIRRSEPTLQQYQSLNGESYRNWWEKYKANGGETCYELYVEDMSETSNILQCFVGDGQITQKEANQTYKKCRSYPKTVVDCLNKMIAESKATATPVTPPKPPVPTNNSTQRQTTSPVLPSEPELDSLFADPIIPRANTVKPITNRPIPRLPNQQQDNLFDSAPELPRVNTSVTQRANATREPTNKLGSDFGENFGNNNAPSRTNYPTRTSSGQPGQLTNSNSRSTTNTPTTADGVYKSDKKRCDTRLKNSTEENKQDTYDKCIKSIQKSLETRIKRKSALTTRLESAKLETKKRAKCRSDNTKNGKLNQSSYNNCLKSTTNPTGSSESNTITTANQQNVTGNCSTITDRVQRGRCILNKSLTGSTVGSTSRFNSQSTPSKPSQSTSNSTSCAGLTGKSWSDCFKSKSGTGSTTTTKSESKTNKTDCGLMNC